jgi:hypothetical protein
VKLVKICNGFVLKYTDDVSSVVMKRYFRRTNST